jgi:hypothetical protein
VDLVVEFKFMVTSVHLVFGAAVGVALKNPAVVVPVAFCTHYLLDAVPHYAPKPVRGFKEGGFGKTDWLDLSLKAVEPILGIVITALLFFNAEAKLKLALLLGAVFGWLPDLLVFLEWKFGIKRPEPFRSFEVKTHKHTGGLRGVWPQAVVFLLSLGVYFLVRF